MLPQAAKQSPNLSLDLAECAGQAKTSARTPAASKVLLIFPLFRSNDAKLCERSCRSRRCRTADDAVVIRVTARSIGLAGRRPARDCRDPSRGPAARVAGVIERRPDGARTLGGSRREVLIAW